MKRRLRIATVLALCAAAAPASAQWAPHLPPGVPLTENGEPDLDAPPPRTADGKPDLTGVWQGARGRTPEDSDGPPVAGFGDVGQNMEGGLPLRPEGAAVLEERRARVLLPRATVFSRRLDNDRTYVHTRTTDLLATRRDDLETRARREAERVLESAALEAGILEKAEASVARTVEGLLRSLGFEEIEVRFDDSPGLEVPALPAPG